MSYLIEKYWNLLISLKYVGIYKYTYLKNVEVYTF